MTPEEITLLDAERDRVGRQFGPSVIDAAMRAEGTGTLLVSRFINSRTLLFIDYVDGTDVLNSLEDTTDRGLQRVYRMLENINDSGGIDIGVLGVRNQLTVASAALSWPAPFMTKVLALGERPKTRSEELFDRQLTLEEIKEAF